MDTKTKTDNTKLRGAFGAFENINQRIDPETVSDIYFAFDHFFPEGAIYSSDSAYSTKNFFWNNQREFKEYVKEKTGITIHDASDKKAIKEAQKRFFDIAEGTAEVEMKGAEESPVDANRPGKETLEQMGEEHEAREAKRVEAIEKTKQQTREDIEALEKRQAEINKTKQQKIKEKPVEPIPTTTLDEKSKQQLFNLSQAIKTDPGTVQNTIRARLKEAVARSPAEVRETITDEVINQYTSDVISTVTPLGVYSNITEMPNTYPKMHPASPIASLANPNNINLQRFVPNADARRILAEDAASLSLAIDGRNQLYRQMTEAWMEPQNVDVLYPDNVVRFEVAEDQQGPNEDGVEINAGDIIDAGEDIEDMYSRIHSATNKKQAAAEVVEEFSSRYSTVYPVYTPATVTTTEGIAVVKETTTFMSVVPTTFGGIYGFRQGALAARWSAQPVALLGTGMGVSTPLLTATAGEMGALSGGFSARVIFNANIGKVSLSVVTLNKGPVQVLAVGGNLGNKVFGGMVASAGKQVAVGVVTETGKQLVTKTVGTKIAGFIGGAISKLSALTGPQGFIIGTLIGAGISALPKIKRFIQENQMPFLVGGAALTLIGLGTGSSLMLGVGIPSTIAGGASVLAGGAGSAITSAGSIITGMFTALAVAIATALAGIGSALAGILLGFPVVVALILFIINSGAYVVPLEPFEAGRGSVVPPDCLGEPPPKPSASGVRFSKDGKYAFPVAPFEVPGYSCYHWDGNKSADIFSPQTRPPLVAYEGGTIVNVKLDDEIGGKYVILQGASGRYYYHAHLCHVFVKGGETVKAGDVIATMDETGSGRVQHLHWAINSPALGDYFLGGDGDICPQKDLEEKFGFGVCKPTNYCVTP